MKKFVTVLDCFMTWRKEGRVEIVLQTKERRAIQCMLHIRMYKTHLNNRTMDSIYNKYGFVIYNGIQE